MTKIKICGLTRLEDAKLALELGVDALGFNFYPKSPRCVSLLQAQTIVHCLPVRGIPPKAWMVGVFVNHTLEDIKTTMRETVLDTIQLHGDESPDFCKALHDWRVIKAIRCKPGLTLKEILSYQNCCELLLLDAFRSDAYGGTGAEVDENLLQEFRVGGIFQHTFLAGGLNPENVASKIKNYLPFGVDVSSGIESAAGVKDHGRLRAFVQAAKTAVKG